MLIQPRRYAFVFLMALLLAGYVSAQTPLSYQGQLKESGVPLDGMVDLEFALFDADEFGNQIGETLALNDVIVEGGLFSVELDFDPLSFDGSGRWIEVAVASPAGSDAFMTLSPRQRVTGVPYALQTRGMFVDEEQDVGIGTSNPHKKLTVQGGMSVFDSEEQGISFHSHSFSISDLPDEDPVYRYSQNTDTHTFYTAGARRLRIAADGNVGIGTVSPQFPLHVAGHAKVGGNLYFDSPGIFEVAHDNNTGMRIDPTNNSVQLECDNTAVLTATNSGRIGIGTATPSHVLDVSGDTRLDGVVNMKDPSGSAANMQLDLTGGYEIFRDDQGAGQDDTRFWFDAPDEGEMAFGPRTGADYLGNMRIRSDKVSFETAAGGASTLRIANGKVGVGNGNPGSVISNSKLDVGNGHIALSNNFGVLSYNSSGNGIGAGFDTEPDDDLALFAGGASRATVKANGNVGIGTSEPDARLHINAVGASGMIIERNDGAYADTKALMNISRNGGPPGLRIMMSDDNGGNYNDSFFISETSNIGIGTVIPQGKVHVEGGTDTSILGGGFLVLGPASGGNISIDNNEIMARNGGAASDLYVQNDGGNVLIGLNGNGYVGIKEVSPEAPLHVAGAAIFEGAVTIPTTTRYTTIGAPAFHPGGSTVVTHLGGTPLLKRDHLAIFAGCSAMSDISLPHGARITKLTAQVEDDSDSNNMTIDIRRYNLTGVFELVGRVTTFGSDNDPRSFSSNVSHTVDAQSFSYYINISWTDLPAETFALRAVRITYTVDQPLP